MRLVSIAIVLTLFWVASFLLAMLARAPAWVAIAPFFFGMIATLCAAVIAADTDEPEASEAPREHKTTKAIAEIVVETRKEYEELEGSKSLTVVRHR